MAAAQVLRVYLPAFFEDLTESLGWALSEVTISLGVAATVFALFVLYECLRWLRGKS